ncbi:MAG: RimK family alpha-L-glutamate ligase [Clostridia bacterium]
MKGIILTNSFYLTQNTIYQSERLASELTYLGVDMRVLANSNAAFVDGKDIQSQFADCDFCIFLDKDKYVSAMLEKLGVRVFNSHKAIELCDDKMETYIKLSGCDIPMPRTVSGLMCYNRDCQPTAEYYDKVEELVGGYPIVVKDCCGSLGTGVFLASNRAQLEELVRQEVGKPYLVQQAIATSFGRDVRVIAVGKKVKAAMLRQSNKDFRSNLGLGGSANEFVLSQEWRELCEKVATILDLDYCGIDVLFGENNKPVICEVNSNAFFGGIEKASGENIAHAYARLILDEMQNKGKK